MRLASQVEADIFIAQAHFTNTWSSAKKEGLF